MDISKIASRIASSRTFEFKGTVYDLGIQMSDLDQSPDVPSLVGQADVVGERNLDRLTHRDIHRKLWLQRVLFEVALRSVYLVQKDGTRGEPSVGETKLHINEESTKLLHRGVNPPPAKV